MEQKLDKQRVQEFARKLFGFYTSGILTLMVDLGHKTGLFEAAAKGAVPIRAAGRYGRLSVFLFLGAIVAAFAGLAFAVGYIVGKLLL